MKSLPCPECGHNLSKVTDSRCVGAYTRRRRECAKCGIRFTTHEVYAPAEDELPPVFKLSGTFFMALKKDT